MTDLIGCLSHPTPYLASVTYFADLTPYAYSHFDHDTVKHDWGTLRYRPRYERLNVGWLDASQPFDTDPVPDWFASALLDVIGNPSVNETRGLHDCEFCPSDANAIADPRPAGRPWLAFREIRVPARPGVMFAAPALIWHYVSAHAYRPPAEFVEAVQRYDAGWATEPSPWIPPDVERKVWNRTAMNIMIPCGSCGRTFELHFTPVGPERSAPSLASQQLRQQCPDHDGKEWQFWDKVR
ncbi:hypothetical protein AB0J72_18335 [Dactylosporangium sp. NPDC049742]|uniref:DUF7919 family protein n=1 Tax=Dactylosporangium sp. NPDC049742 TaxID=3154737 RepID=UPI003444BC6D